MEIRDVLGILIILLSLFGGFLGVQSQNLTAFYGKECNSTAVKADPNQHILQCQPGVPPTTETFLYILLLCIQGTCQCPDKFEIRGKMLNATGYEWVPERGQCLLSTGSECAGLTTRLCASGKCLDGQCYNVTRNGQLELEDGNDSGSNVLSSRELTLFFTTSSLISLLNINLFDWLIF